MSTSETTADHGIIRRWVESRAGRPAMVEGTEDKEGEGPLRVEFAHGDKLEDVDWDQFFRTFYDRNLTLLYQDKTSDGKRSRFFKFVRRGSGH
jgi:hypothetical protein